jgi:CheY-like chemotaxis protein
MNILIVEDQPEKCLDIIKFFDNYYELTPNYRTEESLHGGLKALLSGEDFSLVILDMSMPNFNPSSEDRMGGKPESFAGRELLSQMKLRELLIPVIVVTQYAIFPKGQVSLSELDGELRGEFDGFYMGAVYYSSADNSWNEALEKLIKEL